MRDETLISFSRSASHPHSHSKLHPSSSLQLPFTLDPRILLTPSLGETTASTQAISTAPRHPAMRYQDWDVLLYPKNSDVPFKEFRTTPYAVQDPGGGNFPRGGGGVAGTSGAFTL